MRQKNWPRENNRAQTLPRPFCVFVVVFVNVVFVFQCFSSTKGEKGMFVVMLLKHLAVYLLILARVAQSGIFWQPFFHLVTIVAKTSADLRLQNEQLVKSGKASKSSCRTRE